MSDYFLILISNSFWSNSSSKFCPRPHGTGRAVPVLSFPSPVLHSPPHAGLLFNPSTPSSWHTHTPHLYWAEPSPFSKKHNPLPLQQDPSFVSSFFLCLPALTSMAQPGQQPEPEQCRVAPWGQPHSFCVSPWILKVKEGFVKCKGLSGNLSAPSCRVISHAWPGNRGGRAALGCIQQLWNGVLCLVFPVEKSWLGDLVLQIVKNKVVCRYAGNGQVFSVFCWSKISS